jgi:hypothetical protein
MNKGTELYHMTEEELNDLKKFVASLSEEQRQRLTQVVDELIDAVNKVVETTGSDE